MTMSLETPNGRLVCLEATDSGVSSAEAPTFNVGGDVAAAFKDASRAAKARIRIAAEDKAEQKRIRDIAIAHGIQTIDVFLLDGKLWAHVGWELYMMLCLVSWRVVDGGPFEFDSQQGLRKMLDNPMMPYNAAEKDFVEQMWIGKHVAWIRLMLHAVRMLWKTPVEWAVECVELADMV